MNKLTFFVVGLVMGVVVGVVFSRRSAAPPAVAAAVPAAPGEAPRAVANRATSRSDDAGAQAAVEALEALCSAVKGGITYPLYIDRKVNAHVVVDHYLNGRGQGAPLGIALNDALAAFDDAGTIWSACITSDGCENGLLHMVALTPQLQEIVNRYPGLSNLGEIVTRDAAVAFLWQQGIASTEIARAGSAS